LASRRRRLPVRRLFGLQQLSTKAGYMDQMHGDLFAVIVVVP
jgi:hypothetical protein